MHLTITIERTYLVYGWGSLADFQYNIKVEGWPRCTCPRYKSIMTIENGVWVNISTIFKIFTDLFDDKIYTTIPLSGMMSPGTSFWDDVALSKKFLCGCRHNDQNVGHRKELLRWAGPGEFRRNFELIAMTHILDAQCIEFAKVTSNIT